MAFTQRTFSADWTNAVWVAWQQKLNIQDLGHPSYFIQSRELGAFYPFFAFYGATLYVLAGLLAIPIGSINAVVVLYFAAFLTAYCGWTWLSMQAGLSGLAAYLPGAIAVTAPYAITDAYGRGDFAETVATSMIPLILASALSIFRADRLRAAPVAAFVFSVAILTGSHTVTLLWGSTFLLAAAAIAALSWGGLVRARAGRLLQLAGLSLLGLGMSLWFLVPLVTHANDTLISQNPQSLSEGAYTSIGEIFRPLRSTPQVPPDGFAVIQAQLPVLALVCAVVLLAFAWRRLSRGRRSLIVGLAALLGVVTLLSTTPSLFEHLPRYWRYVEYTERLIPYGDLLVVGLLVLGLAGLRARARAFRYATAAVTTIAVLGTVQAVAQVLAVPSMLTLTDRTTPHSRDVIFIKPDRIPLTWYSFTDFADASQPTARATTVHPLYVPVSAPRRTSYTLTYPPGPASRV